jgi:hypothetical protein
MAGAPAGPALDPERPASRLDAVRETDESRPVRGPGERQPPARISSSTWGFSASATVLCRDAGQQPARHRAGADAAARPAPGGPCRGQRAALEQPRRPPLRRPAAVDVRRDPQAHRARGRATNAAPLTITSSDRPSKPEVEPARKRERVAARIRSRTRSSSGRSSRSCRDRAVGPSDRARSGRPLD